MQRSPSVSLFVYGALALLAIAVGVAAVVLGEGDDSPGLQGIGVLLVVGTVALVVRARARRRPQTRG